MDRPDLVLAAAVAAARAVAALVAQGVVQLPGLLGRHPASLHVQEAVRLRLRRPLSKKETLNADAVREIGRLAVRLAPVEPTGRPPMEAGPDKVRTVPLLVDTVADEVRLVMAVAWLWQPLAELVVAGHVLTTGLRPDARASKLTAMAKRPSHRRAVGRVQAKPGAPTLQPFVAPPVATDDEAWPQKAGQTRHDREAASAALTTGLGNAVGASVAGASRPPVADGLGAPQPPVPPAETILRLPRSAAAAVLVVARRVRQGPSG